MASNVVWLTDKKTGDKSKHSGSPITITLRLIQDREKTMQITSTVSTRVSEIKETLAQTQRVDRDSISFTVKEGRYYRHQRENEEIRAEVFVKGLQAFSTQMLPDVPRSPRLPGHEQLPSKLKKYFPSMPTKMALIRLIVFYGSGDSFYQWAQWMLSTPVWCEAIVYEWPSHGQRKDEQLPPDVDGLVDDAMEELGAVFAQHAKGGEAEHAPIAFLSHSIGALVMVGVAERARRLHGVEPCAAFVLDRAAPHVGMCSEAGERLLREDPSEFNRQCHPFSRQLEARDDEEGKRMFKMWEVEIAYQQCTKPLGYHTFKCPVWVLVAMHSYLPDNPDIQQTMDPEARKQHEGRRIIMGSKPESAAMFDREAFDVWKEWTTADCVVHECETDHMNIKLQDGIHAFLWQTLYSMKEWKNPGEEAALETLEERPREPPPITVGPNAEAPLPIALLFPGQGSQYVTMLEGVQDLPQVQTMLAQAKEILGWDVLDLCLNGPESVIEETRYCQPCMFIAGLAGLEKLKKQKPEAVSRASVMAGLSLGEYTALCAAGVMSFEDGLNLVKLRGEAMQDAGKQGAQSMLSVVGLEAAKVEQLCREAREKEGAKAVCQISKYMFPNGFACGGSEVAMNHLKELAEQAGAKQTQVDRGASGAFHTPLMQPAQEKLAEAIAELLPRMRPPLHTVWMNADHEPIRPGCDVAVIAALMRRQLMHPVYWEQTMQEVLKDGVTDFYEVGPMSQLKGMMKLIDKDAWKNMASISV